MYRKIMVSCIFLVFLVTSCSSPPERRQRLDQLKVHVQLVQSAVDKYCIDNKKIPCRYSAYGRKLTTDHLVDFGILSRYLSEIPSSAFERGGNFIYVLTGIEEDRADVSVFDLRVQDRVEMIQSLVMRYASEHKLFPFRSKVGRELYTIDFTKLGIPDESLPSPYLSGEDLQLLVDDYGNVYVDYRCDVMRMIQERDFKVDGGEDFRLLLSRCGPCVPAYSPIIKYQDGNLVLLPVGK